MGNSFGNIFKLTSFGESHGTEIGGIIDGCPSGLIIDLNFIQKELDRRRPGQSRITTSRTEGDKVVFMSGIFQGKTTGTPIGFTISNNNYKSEDYNDIKNVFRPSHADYTYQEKYGLRDYRGGGRSSARETACRVVAGAVAKLILKTYKIEISAYVLSVGNIFANEDNLSFDNITNSKETNIVRCPDKNAALKMIDFISEIKKKGNTVGGQIKCHVKGVPLGIGEPVFDKLHADLGKAMLSINAVKGFEYGSGFEGSKMLGSDHNDEFESINGKVSTKTNFSGGIQGGLSNGEEIFTISPDLTPILEAISFPNSISFSDGKDPT